MFHFIFKTKLKRNVEIIWSIWLFKDNDSRTQLSCKDNLLARKPRQTNCMLIHGRLEDLVQLNNVSFRISLRWLTYIDNSVDQIINEIQEGGRKEGRK